MNMEELITQFTGKHLAPSSIEDLETLKESYKINQLVRIKTYSIGAKKEPSVIQNNLLHACFALMADNSDNQQLNTKEKVKFACKVALDFRKENLAAVRPDGTIVFEYRSFSFDELPHMERCKIFDRAYEWMAGLMGITVEELISEAQSRMQRRF